MPPASRRSRQPPSDHGGEETLFKELDLTVGDLNRGLGSGTWIGDLSWKLELGV